MAVNVYAGQIQPIQFALTTGHEKVPISALNVTRARLQFFDPDTDAELLELDSSVDANVFFWNRVSQTVKGVADIFLMELELQASGLPIREGLIARLTVYDGNNPLGISWKQFALNSR